MMLRSLLRRLLGRCPVCGVRDGTRHDHCSRCGMIYCICWWLAAKAADERRETELLAPWMQVLEKD